MNDRKRQRYHDRAGLCDLCGERMVPTDRQCHEHHCLVYRSDLPRSKQHTEDGSIDEEINIMLVCADPCHSILQSNREIGRRIKEHQYGEEAVNSYIRRLLPKTYRVRGVKEVKR